MSSSHDTPRPIVIVGASSGGVVAVSRLLEGLPADFPGTVMIAQHLTPERPSQLLEILGRRTGMPVRQVEDHADLETGTVYVIPANRVVEFTDDDISVRKGDRQRPAPSIDRLLESAACAYGERVIAVVLTGSGSDGTAGAQSVKEHEGTVIIQDPETAQYPSMPRSLPPTSVDFVRDLDGIGELLVELANNPVALSEDAAMDTDDLDDILNHLRNETSIDFSQYKTPTIMRRLKRRVLATNCQTLAEYRHYLQKNEDEYYNLINSFLINVTEFFRDRELFDQLRDVVVPELIQQGRERGNQLRVWSAGCATGEEPFSLAILIAEALGDESDQFSVRIFATDIDESAVSFARRGVYSSAAVKEIPEHLKNRYFTRVDGDYEINKQVRSMVVFGKHDLAQRSPFPNIDLILCRNVLIYFTSDLQRRALQLFAYALRNDGLLVLGKSESTNPLSEYFAPEDQRLKIYRRHGDPTPVPVGPVDTTIFTVPRVKPSTSWSGNSSAYAGREHRGQSGSRISEERSDALLYHLQAGVVVIDRNYDIRVLNNMARHYLGIHGPAIGEDLLHLIRTMPLETLRDSIDQAFRLEGVVKVEGAWEIETTSADQLFIELTCQRQGTEASGPDGQLVVLVLTDVTRSVEEKHRVIEERDAERGEKQELSDRVDQLFRNNHQLVQSNQELAQANEEFRVANDQLMVSNEEAQASAEEIETLNEELQTTNEELETLNEELQATVEELNATNEDLQARTFELQDERLQSDAERERLHTVLASMADALLLVDGRGHIVLMNDACIEMFGEDISQLRPENEDAQPLAFQEGPIYRATREQSFTMHFTIRTEDGERRWYEASGQPLREGAENPGTVVVIRDITDRSLRILQEEFVSIASHELRTPLTALRGYLEMLQKQLSDTDERSQRYVSVSLDMVGRLVGLINDLLDVGRLQSGKFELSLEDVDLSSIVEGSIELCQATTTSHMIELDAPKEPVYTRADATRVQQALLNLLTNAIRYSPDADRINVRLNVEGDQAFLSIQDFGIGMTTEAASQVFSRFYQGERVKSPGPQQGLGLGLYISKEIVEAHSGQIWVDSEPGEGSTFWVRIPLTQPGE